MIQTITNEKSTDTFTAQLSGYLFHETGDTFFKLREMGKEVRISNEKACGCQ